MKMTINPKCDCGNNHDFVVVKITHTVRWRESQSKRTSERFELPVGELEITLECPICERIDNVVIVSNLDDLQFQTCEFTSE